MNANTTLHPAQDRRAPVPSPDPTARPLRIEGSLTIATVSDWRPRLAVAVGRSATTTVDLTDVAEADVFGLQLLLAARRGAEAHGGSFRASGASDVVRRVCREAGIEPAMLGLSPS